jgi:SAM-dependent methyltransferase
MNVLRQLARCKLNPNWYKYAVGGKWDEIGKLQFDFMVSQGLKPEHYLLDIGCGSLRGGLHFIRYLEPGRYWGIDNNQALLGVGKRLVFDNGLAHKRPFLTYLQNFEFGLDCIKVDFAIAQSLFTHLPLKKIWQCIENVKPVLNGEFYATFFEGDNVRQINNDTFAYPFFFFQDICFENGMNVEYIGDWGHPRGQKMMRIYKEKEKP